MGKLFAAVGALEGLLAAVNPQVLLQMVLEFKGFVAIIAFEFAQQCAFVVADHVSLQPVNIREALVADLARLLNKKVEFNKSDRLTT